MEWDSNEDTGFEKKDDLVVVVHRAGPEPTESVAAGGKDDGAMTQSHRISRRRTGKQARRPHAQCNSHNLVEKRYRANLNKKIAELGEAVPCLRPAAMQRQETSGVGETPERSPQSNKATVLSKAIEYIHELETRNRLLEKEIVAMKQYVTTIKHQAVTTDPNDGRDLPTDAEQAQHTMAESTTSIRGMIQVPPEIRELHRHHLQIQHAEPALCRQECSDGRSDGDGEPPRGRLHVGSLVL